VQSSVDREISSCTNVGQKGLKTESTWKPIWPQALDWPVEATESMDLHIRRSMTERDIVQELCESRGGRPGLSVLTSLLVSVDVKNC